MEELRIEYLPVDALKPYERNARKHAEADVEAIVRSIEEFGFDDPIGVWGEENIIVEGHGRLEAAKQLAMETVPVIRLDHLTDEQRRAYALAHNRTAELSIWDEALKKSEIESITNIDMTAFGFENLLDGEAENPYTDKIKIPQYSVKGDFVPVADCFDKEKYDELINEIDSADIPEDVKVFLRFAAGRHIVFNYRNIAEYYAAAPVEVQRLMEHSALVIIDYDDAIANGFVVLSDRLKKMREQNA